jgi:hypothetical protein
LNPSRPITYINKIFRKSRFTKGNPVFSKFALLSILAKNQSIIDFQSLFTSSYFGVRKLFGKFVLTQEKGLDNFIGELLAGKEPSIPKIVKKQMFFDEPWVRVELYRRINPVLKFNLDETCKDLAARTFMVLYGFEYILPRDLDFHTSSVKDYDVQTLYFTFYMMFYYHLDCKILHSLPSIDSISLKDVDEVARLMERVKVLERSLEKAKGENKPLGKLDPLKLSLNPISFIHKMNKRRPK